MGSARNGKRLAPPGSEEATLTLAHVNYWLNGIPCALAAQEKAGYEADPTWTAIRAENSQDSRDRVAKIMRLITDRKKPELDKALAIYICKPYIEFSADDASARVSYHPADPGPEGFNERTLGVHYSQVPRGEVAAVLSLLQLAAKGQLDLVLVCPICKEMFLPSRGSQINCSTECSKVAYASNKETRVRRMMKARKQYDETFPSVQRKRKARMPI